MHSLSVCSRLLHSVEQSLFIVLLYNFKSDNESHLSQFESVSTKILYSIKVILSLICFFVDFENYPMTKKGTSIKFYLFLFSSFNSSDHTPIMNDSPPPTPKKLYLIDR